MKNEEFLHQDEDIPAVKLNVNLKDDKVSLSISVAILSFPLLKTEDLDIGTVSIERFIDGQVDSLESRVCHH